jgi:putative spermidine/putrescine transport system permease protein
MRHSRAALLANALALLIALPFVVLLLYSLARSWRYPDLWPSAWQFDQWLLFGAQWRSLGAAALRSLSLAVLVALAATSAGFFTSHAVARRVDRHGWLALGLLLFAVPPVIYALSIGQAYAALDLNGRYGGVLLAQLPFAYAYAVLICRGYWTRPTRELGELAVALGARPAQVWWRVHAPLARGLLGVCLFQTALVSWFDFALVRIIGAGHVETLTLEVFDYLGAGDLRQAAAAALLLLLPPCLALVLEPRLLWPPLATRVAP